MPLPLADDALLWVTALPSAGGRESFRGETGHVPDKVTATQWSLAEMGWGFL